MAAQEPSPATTLALILGAQEWPECPGLDASTAFAASAKEFETYLCAPSGLGLPERNVKSFFDDQRSPGIILKDAGDFLKRRQDELEQEQNYASDLILYYVGHAGFVGAHDVYCLFLRFTREGELDGTRP
jgi:hypothetical protein